MTDATVAGRGHFRRLAEFTGKGYDKGRSPLVCAAWALAAEPLTRSVLCPPAARARVLRAFGAKIGQNVNIRNDVRIHWPWKLTVGDNSWIGVGSYLLNLEPITIGSDVCISQQTFLCTGSHRADDRAFEFDNGPITVEDGAWVAARATVLRGVTVGRDAVVGATALVFKDVPAGARVLAPQNEVRERQL
ncbi:DapH/DapD/GlmU-related protein [Luteococcus sp. H138]|uniref:DapH/DapD/GlmU-related protein n=1 Tax=unclassified Luteococcus TaxID=2639923 RepID=UPI00313D1C6A